MGTARSGIVVGPHPDSDELTVLTGQENNLSLPPRSLAYKARDGSERGTRIAYQGLSEATVAQLLRVPEDEEEKSALAEAGEFLLSEFARSPVSAKAIKKSSREAEISEWTLRRAKQILGCDRRRRATAPGRGACRIRGSKGAKPPPLAERPGCGARCRDGGSCKAPPVWDKRLDRPVNSRCRMHGRLSTGPNTEEGRRRIAEANRARSANAPPGEKRGKREEVTRQGYTH